MTKARKIKKNSLFLFFDSFFLPPFESYLIYRCASHLPLYHYNHQRRKISWHFAEWFHVNIQEFGTTMAKQVTLQIRCYELCVFVFICRTNNNACEIDLENWDSMHIQIPLPCLLSFRQAEWTCLANYHTHAKPAVQTCSHSVVCDKRIQQEEISIGKWKS